MYIATNDLTGDDRGVLRVLPMQLVKYLCRISLDGMQELKLISGKPLSIRFFDGVFYVTEKGMLSRQPHNAVRVTDAQMTELLERVTRSSLYSVKDEIKNGYITIEGGHRVGIAGTAVTENGSVEFIKNISAMNIRRAAEVIGAADSVMAHIDQNPVKSALVISPPCCGKTTMLRDIARSLSHSGHSVGIADERCELAAMYNGRSPFDLGNLTTVLDNCPKAQGMLMLLRSMSPEVIITDEIGSAEECEAIQSIMNSGVAVIASVHGRNADGLMKRTHLSRLVPMFDTVITLSQKIGEVAEIRDA